MQATERAQERGTELEGTIAPEGTDAATVEPQSHTTQVGSTFPMSFDAWTC